LGSVGNSIVGSRPSSTRLQSSGQRRSSAGIARGSSLTGASGHANRLAGRESTPVTQNHKAIEQPLHACVYCGFCERFGCEHYAKSSPQTIVMPVLLKNPNFELRTGCQVLRITLDSTGRKATGVVYTDAAGHEFEQPAELVLVTALT